MSRTQKRDLTLGSVPRQLIRFSIPFLISNLLQTLYNVADMVIVGQFLGTNGISGVNIGGQATMAISSIVMGFSMGGTILVSQYVGAKREKDASETIGTLLSVFIIAGIVFTILGLIFAEPLLKLINTPPESYADALSYLTITMSGLTFIFGYNAISGILRGVGDSFRPMVFVGIATVTNVILDLLLVGSMGVAGSAIATVVSQGLSLLLSVTHLYRSKFIFDFKLKSFRIKVDKLKNMFKIGFPTAIQMSLTSASFLIVTYLINQYGVVASAGVGVGTRVDGFAILPCIAFSAAISPMVGQNIGAEKFDRAVDTLKIGMIMGISVSLIMAVIVNIIPEPIVRLFNNDQEAVDVAVAFLRYSSWHYPLMAAVFALNGLATGAGNTLFTLVNSLIHAVIMRMGLGWFFSMVAGMGLNGIFLSFVLSPIASLIIGIIYVKSGRWKETGVKISAIKQGAEAV